MLPAGLAALSLVLSVLVLVLGSETQLLGLLVVLVGSCFGVVVEILIRNEPSELEALLGRLRPVDELGFRQTLDRVLEHALMVQSHDSRFFDDEMKLALQRFQRNTRELASGKIERKPNSEFLLEQVKGVQRTLYAVTDSRDVPWWRSLVGTAFFKANIVLRGKGVVIERVFLHDGSAEMTQLMEAHRQEGIICHCVDQRGCDRDLVVNMTIFDERLVHEDIHGDHGETKAHRYSIAPDDVADAIRCFRDLVRQPELRER